MNITKAEISDVLILEPEVSGDERGFFMESFNQKAFEKVVGRRAGFVQDNHSKSIRDILRGLHYQLEPYAQDKLVRCVVGEVFGIAADIRKSSGTSGKWVRINLSAKNERQLWTPGGFTHGFLILSDLTEVLYKMSQYYAPSYGRNIVWNDPLLNTK